ncbi:uncharacterized protein FLJ43738 isoform X1 [Hydra vulgaris]|uniref:uncharacterized protein FLJ43738 isoform X1 n=2 Tax=Hydra vulgaris TaxID=6087 RepID=UPI001F5F6C23|nr:uncharacterized protein FLJ43738 [Hydra vulgaris]XP_047133276.1 uncharacterized protein FLJ43738 [Hydra vulgaris]
MMLKDKKNDAEHEVTFTVTVAKAALTSDGLQSKKMPKVQSYFHCEYKLLPIDDDYSQFDVISFGIAAKLYNGGESKVLRTFQDENKTWVVWNTSRRVLIDKKLLLDTFHHTVELNVWNSKKRVSSQARFDRPKAFFIPKMLRYDEVDLDFIKKMLIQEEKDFSFDVFKKTKLKTYSSDNLALLKKRYIEKSEKYINVQVRLNANNEPELKNIFMLASSGDKPLVFDTKEEDFMGHTYNLTSDVTDSSSCQLAEKKRNVVRKDSKGIIGAIKIPLSDFFSGSTVKSAKLHTEHSLLTDVIIIISLDKPLLSSKQNHDLNPMVITVASATNMPDKLLSFNDLKNRCLPPYVRYCLFENEPHTSLYKEHGSTIHFNDRFIVLLGLIKKNKLIEYLLGPPFKIEVHDRDPKPCIAPAAALFGEKDNDPEISTLDYLVNPPHEGFFELSYGVAEFDLSELVTGKQLYKMVSLIKTHFESNNGEHINYNEAEKIPEGNYTESGSELKVQIKLARNLGYLINRTVISGSLSSINTRNINFECPFNRMVFIVDYSYNWFIQNLLELVSKINDAALNLTVSHQTLKPFSQSQLSEEQLFDKSLDVITGCHIADGILHIVFLEGLTYSSIDKLWKDLSHPEKRESSVFRILYNSKMSFSMRLYTSLDFNTRCIKLNQPISMIVKHSLIYVRMFPRLCFKAIQKVFQLCSCESLCCASKTELFPSNEMILALKEEFGVLLDAKHYHALGSHLETGSEYSLSSSQELYINTLFEEVEKKFSSSLREKVETRLPDVIKQNHYKDMDKRKKEEKKCTYAKEDLTIQILSAQTKERERRVKKLVLNDQIRKRHKKFITLECNSIGIGTTD